MSKSFEKISDTLKQIADNTTSYKDADEVLGYYKDRFESFENIINNPELGADDDIKFNKYGKINEWLAKRQKRIEGLKSKKSFDFSSLRRVLKTLDRALGKMVCELIVASFKANNQSKNLTREIQQFIACRGTIAVAQAQAKGKKAALFFGSEGYGLDKKTIKACDITTIIPMSHQVDSLNVAASSAVAFWELFAR